VTRPEARVLCSTALLDDALHNANILSPDVWFRWTLLMNTAPFEMVG